MNGQPISACRRNSQKPFKSGGQTGRGLQSAFSTGRIWCSSCFKNLDSASCDLWRKMASASVSGA
eukprot:2069353-Karenia_brevis.AAC.1